MRHAGGFVGEGVPGIGIGFPDGFVVCLVGFAQVGGHGEHGVIIAYSGLVVGKDGRQVAALCLR